MPALQGLERIYQRELKKPLKRLNLLKWLVPFSWFYTTLYLILATSIVFSLILGFIPDIDLGIAYDRETQVKMMYAVTYIGIWGICWERLSNYVSLRVEILRNSKLLTFFLSLLFAIIIFLIAWYIGNNYLGSELNNQLMTRMGILISTAVVLVLPYFAFNKYQEKFKNQYKSLVITKLLPLLELNLEYNTVDRIPSSSFVKSKLYPCGEIAHYGSSDKFVGRSDDLRFELCQLDVSHHKKVGNRIRIIPRYKGLFYRFETKGHFDGQGLIPSEELKNEVGEGMVDVLNSLLTRTDITYSQVGINENTNVYSTHPDEAKKIFGPELLDKLETIKGKFNSDVSLSYAEDNVYVTIPMEKDYLWPGGGNFDDYQKLEEHLIQIEDLVNVPLSLKDCFSS